MKKKIYTSIIYLFHLMYISRKEGGHYRSTQLKCYFNLKLDQKIKIKL